MLARLVSLGALALVGLAHWVVPEPPRQGEALAWVAPPGCPGAPEVRQRLSRLLRDEVAVVRADARVSARASRWRVDLALQWKGHHDVRTLEADRCDTLADATVLLVASAADPLEVLLHVPGPSPTAGARVPEPPPAREAAAPRVAPREAAVPEAALGPAPPPAPTSNDDRPAPPRDAGPAVGVLGMLDFGSMPRAAVGLGISIGWRWPRARLFAEGTYLPAQQVRSSVPQVRFGRVQLGMARLGACGRPRVRSVELPLCGGIEAGGTRADGFSPRPDPDALDRWLAPFVHGGVVIPLMPSVAAVARVEVAVPLMYSEYLFAGQGLYRPRPVAVRGAFGLEFRWGPRNAGQPENPPGGTG